MKRLDVMNFQFPRTAATGTLWMSLQMFTSNSWPLRRTSATWWNLSNFGMQVVPEPCNHWIRNASEPYAQRLCDVGPPLHSSRLPKRWYVP